MAAALAEQPYAPRRAKPSRWADLGYDQYHQIRHKAEHSIWRGESMFELQYLHTGFLFDEPVSINYVEGGEVFPAHYRSGLFDLDSVPGEVRGQPGAGFAGLRLLYPLNNRNEPLEFFVFRGASYFRFIGRQQTYGLSARGIAVNTAGAEPEQFPAFVEFWVEKPEGDATSIRIHALLDGPSVTGAYRFTIRPRTATQVGVEAVLFAREDIDKIGFAPMTSMYFYGENSPYPVPSVHPEAHDSDGLMVHTAWNEWIWRPLNNHTFLNISSFFVNTPKGFGLIQRDLDFDHYQDIEFRYHQRPSMWIEPRNDWGRGHVELIEIPTDRDSNDNVVCYWVPERPVVAGDTIELSYIMTAYLENPQYPPGGRTLSTRIGIEPDALGVLEADRDTLRFVIDFDYGDLPFIDAGQPVEPVFMSSSGKISNLWAEKNPVTGGWRASFDFEPDGVKPADFRGFLRLRGHALTETWNYLWTRKIYPDEN